MKPAFAKSAEDNSLEDLGRATMQIVHDLKNHLNGLKLYATFLRKRLEREDRSPEERETVAKIIAGLDRAAREMTALVRYGQRIEIHPRPNTDLRKMMIDLAREAASQLSAQSPGNSIAVEIEGRALVGELDPVALAEALRSFTEIAMTSALPKDVCEISLHVRRTGPPESPEALIEWNGAKLITRPGASTTFADGATVHEALAARVIKAHGGRVDYGPTSIKVWLPLSE